LALEIICPKERQGFLLVAIKGPPEYKKHTEEEKQVLPSYDCVLCPIGRNS
jgi:hypothetical protein